MADFSDADEFSEDEFYANLPENDFDLLEINEEERRRVNEEFRGAGDNSGDELDDENLPLFFERPVFEWTGGAGEYYALPNSGPDDPI